MLDYREHQLLPALVLVVGSILLSLSQLSVASAQAFTPASFGSTSTIVYVSQGGDDLNDGLTPATALQTIETAIDRAGAQTSISVAAGVYSPFTIADRQDLRLSADPGVTITDGHFDRRACIKIERSDRVLVDGFEVHNCLWGVVVRTSSEVRLTNLSVHDVGQEGVRINEYSSDVSLTDSTITKTGLRGGAYVRFGEGVYLGTGSGREDDDTHGITIRNNDISHTTSEAIDVKPMVYDVSIELNYVHDVQTNTSGAIAVGIGTRIYRDPEVEIRGNIIWNISTSTEWEDGTAISLSAATVVEANVIWGTQHYGVLIDGHFVSSERTVFVTSNAIFDTGKEPVKQRLGPDPASATLDGNVTEDQVSPELSSAPIAASGGPSQVVIAIRDQLLAAVGEGSATPTTTPPAVSPGSTELATTIPPEEPDPGVTDPAITHSSPTSEVTQLEPSSSTTVSQPALEQSDTASPPIAAPSTDSLDSATQTTPTVPSSHPGRHPVQLPLVVKTPMTYLEKVFAPAGTARADQPDGRLGENQMIPEVLAMADTSTSRATKISRWPRLGVAMAFSAFILLTTLRFRFSRPRLR